MNSKLQKYSRIINSLHSKWNPHEGQIKIGRALFQDECKEIFVQCGRKWGKTEIVCYLLWRWALTHDNAQCYYTAPYQDQGREIVWANSRLPYFGSEEFLDGKPNDTQMRVNFKNGSFIKVEGSDNVESRRGINPDFIVYDEFKDFRPEWHVAMEPNLVSKKAPLVILGTPPDHYCQFTELADEFQKNPSKRYFEAPSWENPHLDAKWLLNKKNELYERGEGDIWEREYGARFVPGGPNAVFPMLTKSHIRDHDDIMREISRDRKKLEWYCIADPGTTTCFAVLYGAVNPYTKTIYLLDEIYQTDQKKTSVNMIGREIIDGQIALWDDAEWMEYCDSAAAWFMQEMGDRYKKYFSPTNKFAVTKETGLSLIKDCLLQGRIVFSNKCEKLFWEMQNYVKDKNGKVPKLNDHLIDCLRYMLAANHYGITTTREAEAYNDLSTKTHFTPEDDFPDSFSDIESDLVSDDELL